MAGRKKGEKNVFTGPEKMEIAKLFGWYWTATEIIDHMKENYGKTCTKQNLFYFQKRKEWIPIIEKFREDFNKVLLDVPLANKKKRLVELQKHYDRHMRDDNLKDAQDVIKDVKSEMDEKFGDVSFHFTQINHTEFKDMSDEDLLKEKAKTLEEFERVKRKRMLLEGGSDGLGSKTIQEIKKIQETRQ